MDDRLIRRWDGKVDLFHAMENAVELPAIRNGYYSVPVFLAHALSVLQRRMSRSGLSLELHELEILLEENFREDLDFSYQPASEKNKKQEFLLPGGADYGNTDYSANKMRMLGDKTTCKVGWRQILNEADLIPVRNLLTMHEGVSERQFSEMRAARVRLVVPLNLHSKYTITVGPHRQTFADFLEDIRYLRR